MDEVLVKRKKEGEKARKGCGRVVGCYTALIACWNLNARITASVLNHRTCSARCSKAESRSIMAGHEVTLRRYRSAYRLALSVDCCCVCTLLVFSLLLFL